MSGLLNKAMLASCLCGLAVMMPSGALAGEVLSGDTAIGFFGHLEVGINAFGSYTVDGGSVVNQFGIAIGVNQSGSGEVTAVGPGTTILLTGDFNPLGVGEQGAGAMTVSGGSVVDGSAGVSCPAAACNFFVGNGAGSSGSLTITDSDSRLTTANALVIGNASVFIQANDGFDFGIPGGSTTASLAVLNGAELHSQRAIISLGPFGGSPTGTETTDATVTVSGGGSQWTLDEFLAISPGANSTGTLIVSKNGYVSTPQLSVASTGTSVGSLLLSDGASVEVGGFRVGEGADSIGTVMISKAQLTNHRASEGQWIIGLSGDATLKIMNGSQVINDQASGVIVGQSASSNAKVSLIGMGSLFDAGTALGLGWDLNSDSAGGVCKVNLGQGTVMRADQIIVGPGCTIQGRGTLRGVVTNNGGRIAPGVTIEP